MFNLDRYLERLQYTGPLAPTLETLRALHLAHMLAVPFENLDIHLGRKILLDEEYLFDKVVVQRRGGYCFELNGLFARLLGELGFNVTRLSAGVWESDRQRFGPDCDHMCLRVQFAGGESWLADVGFGDSFLEPLRLEAGCDHVQRGKHYRVLRDGDEWKMLDDTPDGYWFGLRPRRLYDFTYANHFMQTSPDSSFTRKLVCSRATAAGRITLSDMRLITTADGRRTEHTLSNQAERLSVLAEHFGILLPPDTVFTSPVITQNS